MFRSLTDEQLVYRHTGGLAYEWPSGVLSMFPTGDGISLRLRVECIPSRDPLPYKCTDGTRHANYCALGFPVRFVPRPEFARPPVNRVLVEYRKGEYNHDTDAWIWEGTDVTPAEISHARKVLAKLAAVYA